MTNKKAKDAYERKQRNVHTLLIDIEHHIMEHDIQTTKIRRRVDWGDVGELAQVEEYLQLVINFLENKE